MSQNPPATAPVIDAASVDAAITSRLSARAFLPQPVPRATLEHLLEVAARAPSLSSNRMRRRFSKAPP